jgi:Fe-S cluster biogenesis protein NfuA
VTEDGIVKVRLLGACEGCPMRAMTLTQGITRFIKKKVPEVKEVQSV